MKTISVTAADQTLFHIAAREIGNALEAVRIAQASGIGDPWLDGTQQVNVPGKGPNTGGLPAPGTIVP